MTLDSFLSRLRIRGKQKPNTSPSNDKDASPKLQPTKSADSSPSRNRFSLSSRPSPLTRSGKSQRSRKSISNDGVAASRDSFEMVKRRVCVPVSLFDRPLITSIEFIIDARYHGLKVIGSGSFGVVASARDSQTGHRVAIKKILGAFATLRMARYSLREVRLLRHLRHKHIVRLLDIDVPRQYRAWDEVYIITPLLRMDLRTAMNNRELKDVNMCKRIAFQMLSALEHMHALGLMHRDVKSRNIVLDADFNVQLCDLGHSRFYSRSNRQLDIELDANVAPTDQPELSGAVTTVTQSAPEIGLGAEYDCTVDIWAAGCVIAEMVHPEHQMLFDSTGRKSHLHEICNIVGQPMEDDLVGMPEHALWYAQLLRKPRRKGDVYSDGGAKGIRARLGEETDDVVVDLLENMLRFSPAKRLSATKALEHPWFDEVREPRDDDRETYDFGQSEPHRKSSRSDLKNLMWQEVVAFHPEAPQMGIR